MKLTIEQEHIDAADAAKKYWTNSLSIICPLAQVLISAGYHAVVVRPPKAHAVGHTWIIDNMGTDWINEWDAGLDPAPITLELQEEA